MTDARNVYPRLCWGCLSVIESYEHDQALLNYGGYCVACVDGEKPGLRDALQGRPERMNDVSEQEELLREVSMSGGHTILYHGHVPAGTTLDNADSGLPSGTYNVTFGPSGTTINPTLLNPGGPALQWNSYPGPWIDPTPIQFVPSNTFPTEESLRAFVRKCVHEELDELARELRENMAFKPTSRVE